MTEQFDHLPGSTFDDIAATEPSTMNLYASAHGLALARGGEPREHWVRCAEREVSASS